MTNELLSSVVETGMNPALALLPSRMDSPEARVMLLAICGQEAAWKHRVQVLNGGRRGPAHGLLQFERGGGCKGVITHPASRYWAHALCEARGVQFTAMAVWRQLEHDDVLAFGFGRLLLFTDPKRLPAITDAAGAWALYMRCWRAGKPHPKAWPANHRAAVAAVTGDLE